MCGARAGIGVCRVASLLMNSKDRSADWPKGTMFAHGLGAVAEKMTFSHKTSPVNASLETERVGSTREQLHRPKVAGLEDSDAGRWRLEHRLAGPIFPQ